MSNKRPRGTGRNLGQEIIDRLEDFNRSLRANESVCTKYTTRKVQINLQPTPYSPELVKKARELMNMSQSLFAKFLGVSKKTVQSWEQGIAAPNDMAARFLDEIRHDPDYWRVRFFELVSSTDAPSSC